MPRPRYSTGLAAVGLLSMWTGACLTLDRSGTADAGGGGRCGEAGVCDDGIACTTDRCTDDRCEHVPDDTACAGSAVCDPSRGCVGGCVEGETCIPVGCETAVCEGGRCVRTTACGAEEFCCNGACCGDDDHPCTTAECTPAGCAQVPNDGATCDDDLFCNGADTCMDGSCSVHAGDPCEGSLTCDASMDACVGCVTTDDCPSPVFGPSGSCSFSSTCDESGTRAGTMTSFECMDETCVMMISEETGDCTRDTDGRECNDGMFCNGLDSCSGGSCSNHAGDPCAEMSGTDRCDESTSMCVECLDNADCDDGNPCTSDACSSGACISMDEPDGTDCGGDMTCTDGVCT